MADPTEQDRIETAALARRARALQLAEDVADLAKDLTSRLEEMSMQVDLMPEEILDLVREQTAGHHPEYDIAYDAWAHLYPAAALTNHGTPIERVIGRLFEDAPKLEDASGKAVPRQALALPQAMVVLKSGMQIQGAMSTTPEGTLRMMTPSKDETNRVILIEQFFDYADVSMVAVPREMPKIAGPSPIVLARS